jgi:hypothetical protein
MSFRVRTSVLALLLALAGCAGGVPVKPAGKPGGPVGAVHGRVVGKDAAASGLGGVVVHVGGRDGVSADLSDAPVAADAEQLPAFKELPRLVVLHDFGDGKGPVPAERRLTPRGAAYLHAGEFLVEGVPAGEQPLTAEQAGLAATGPAVAVTADAVAEAGSLALDVVPVRPQANGRPPALVMGTGPLVRAGDRLKFSVAAPAGSRGARLAAALVSYRQGDRRYDYRLPLRAFVPPAQPWGPGPAIALTLPLDRASLAPDATIEVTLIDEEGFGIQGPAYQRLVLAAGGAAPTPVTPAAGKGLGSIRGFIFGAGGYSQPLAGLTVRAGALSTTTADGLGVAPGVAPFGGPAVGEADAAPILPLASPFVVDHAVRGVLAAGEAIEEAHEFDDPTNANRTLWVMHDFHDGDGPVATERRVRKHALGGDRHGRYAYMRAGEFLLEDVPAGPVTLTTDGYCGVAGVPQPLVVAADQELSGVRLAVDVREVVSSGSVRPPHLVTWAGTTPDVLAFAVQDAGTDHPKASLAGPAKLQLAAAAYSQALAIKAVDLVWTWSTPARQAAGEPMRQAGHLRLPVDVHVPTATGECPGASVSCEVELGGPDLSAIFQDADAPGLVIANLAFVDEQGFAVLDRNYQPLQIEVPLVRTP